MLFVRDASYPAMHRSPLSPRRLTWMASLMVVIGPLSLSLYTPAMPSLAVRLGTDAATIRFSLTVYLIGFALAQLACGPLSDRFGRRPVLLVFTVIYIIGSLLALPADGPGLLLAARLVQGVGACAGVALSRAIIRDRAQGLAAVRLMAVVALALSVAPALAPLLGSLLLRTGDWHTIFVAMAAYGLFLALAVAAFLPETNLQPDRFALVPGRLARTYARLATDAEFLRPTLAMAAALGGIYSFHAITPFVYMDNLGLSPERFALVTVSGALSFAAGARTAGLLLRRRDPALVLAAGLWLLAAAALLLACQLLLLAPSIPGVAFPVGLWAFGAALILPGASVEGMAPFPTSAGAAAALMGFAQMLAGVAGSSFAAALPSSPVALAVVPATLALVALASHYGLRRPAESA